MDGIRILPDEAYVFRARGEALAASLREDAKHGTSVFAGSSKRGYAQTLSLWEKGQRLPSVEDVSATSRCCR